MAKKIIYIVTLVLAIGLCALMIGTKVKEDKTAARYEELNAQRRPFAVKKAKLEQELVDLEQAYEVEVEPNAVTQVVFPELDEQVYSACYPIMKEYNYVGTLSLSLTEFPGEPGCMSVEQFQELLDAGWGICITWQTQTSHSQWLPQLQSKLTALEVEQEQAVYFPKGTYSADLDETIQQAGFSIAISGTTDAEIPLQTKYEENIWHVGAVGLMSSKPRLWLNEAVAQKANIVYIVGFELEEELYNENSFRSMLKCFREYEDTNELIVTTIDEAKDNFFYRGKGVDPEFEAQYQAKKAELEEQLSQVKQQLKEIEEQY